MEQPDRTRPPDAPRRRRRFPITAGVATAVFTVAALVWTLVAVPALVRYPTDLVAEPRYEGNFRLLVNPATAAPLDSPLDLPLTVERRIEGVPDESDGSLVLVRETIGQRAGELIDMTQHHAYVMDRSTLLNQADPRAFAFDPANVVDRSGTYRLNLPFDTGGEGGYQIYMNETGRSYTMDPDPAQPTIEVEGLSLHNFIAALSEVPVTEAYLADLGQAAALPLSLTMEQLRPHLEPRGIDLEGLNAALAPALSAEDAATLSAALAEPVPLDYVMSFNGRAGVEPATGAQVSVDVSQTLGVRPRLTGLPAIRDVLGRYPQVPEAAAAASALDRLTTDPAIPVFSYEYGQTPESVADVARQASSNRDRVLLARRWVPMALAGLAGLSLLIGLVVLVRRRPPPPEPDDRAGSGPAPGPTAESRPLATTARRSR